jgi:hypothetical protein
MKVKFNHSKKMKVLNNLSTKKYKSFQNVYSATNLYAYGEMVFLIKNFRQFNI